MKKILTVSLVAMMSVTAANAQIASKAYVDSGAGNYVTADNTAGENIKALDTQVKINTDKLPGGETTVADAIATALQNAKVASAIQGVQKNGTALTPDANGVVNVTVPTGALASKDTIATADIDAKAVTAAKLSDEVNASLALADSAMQSSDIANMQTTTNLVTNFTNADDTHYPSAKAVDDRLDAVESTAGAALSATDAASTYLSKTDAASTYLSQTDAASTYQEQALVTNFTNADDTHYPSAKAVDDRLDAVESTAGAALSATDAASTYLSKTDAASTYLSQTDAASTYQEQALVTNFTNADDTHYPSAKAVDDRLDAVESTAGSALQSANITASSANSIVQYGTNGLVISGTPAGALAVKDTVATADINANAVTLAKLSASLPNDCTGTGVECVLKSSSGELAWEVIARADNGQ